MSFDPSHWAIPQWIVAGLYVLSLIGLISGREPTVASGEMRCLSLFVAFGLLVWGGFFK